MDPDIAIRITRQLADALDYAHKHGILHLCINPENILISESGTLLLINFGVDAASELSWVHARRSQYCPVHYISPEQAANKAIEERSDLYSLGVVFYQMLTDRLPLDAEDPQTIRKRHLTQTPLPPHFYSQDVSAQLSSVVMCLLEKDPRTRYQTARALREALDRFGNQNRVVTPIEEKPVYQTPVEEKKNKVTLPTIEDQQVERKPIQEKKGQVTLSGFEDGLRESIENKKSQVRLQPDEFDESPIIIETMPAAPVLQTCEPPSITVIDPASHEILHQHGAENLASLQEHNRVLVRTLGAEWLQSKSYRPPLDV